MKSSLPITIALGVLIVAATAGVIAVSWHLVENIDQTRQKVKDYNVRARNPFASSSIPEFFELDSVSKNRRKIFPTCAEYIRTAKTLRAQHDFEKSILNYNQAINEYNKADDSRKGHDDIYFLADCHRGLSECYIGLKNYPAALKHINETLTVRQKVSDLRVRARIYRNLGLPAKAAADERAENELKNSQTNLLEDL